MKLNDYVTLGKSGLRVSPLCLGAMTFGTDWGWGADDAGARAIFDRYVDAGGNFIDTADAYLGGKSEELVGSFVKQRKLRERLVLATKFSFNTEAGNPNAGGNGRKNIERALEGSLRRLGTDYVDVYWLHAWDQLTPIEEVLSSCDSLVKRGLVRYVGLSNVPAWYTARYQTLAETSFRERLVALQLEYSLVERNLEREHLPLAHELGLGIVPWSPLASGFLTGKYQRESPGSAGNAGARGRLDVVKDSGNPVFEKLTEQNFQILDVLRGVAGELGRTPAEVALAFVAGRPGVSSTLIGATKLAQLDANLGALELALPSEVADRLERATRPELVQPYTYFAEPFTGMLNGGVAVRGWADLPR